jgi:spermidine/putrescine transport system permease protein
MYLFIFSFNSSKNLTKFEGVSLKWFGELFKTEPFINAIIVTLTIAILATIISTIIGTLGAIGLLKLKKRRKDAILFATNLPIVNPEIVTAVSLLMFFVAFSIQPGFTPMLLAHISFCTPYVIITVYPKVKKLDANILEAAMDLGATPFQALIKVLLPQLTTSIFAAASIAFTMSFDDFIISYFTGGDIENISMYLYNAGKRMGNVLPILNAFTTLLTLSIVLLIVIRTLLKKLMKKKEFLEEE